MPAKWYRKVFEEDPGAMVIQGGQPRLGLRVSMQDEEVEQIRQGYECINCFEPLSEAFPASCPLCGYPIKDEQMKQFAAVFKGYVPGIRTGPDWDAQADALEDRAERRAFQRKAEKQGVSVPTIIVPKDM